MNPAPGRYRYALTRPCLESGSLTVLRYLEPALPLSGSLVFVGDAGEEITLRADPFTKRLTGLGDYYAKHKLGVNDLLYITPLGERRFQLEHVQRPRDEARPPEKARPAPPPTRVIEDAGTHVRVVREVREVRPERDARVSPYPPDLIYPHTEGPAQTAQGAPEPRPVHEHPPVPAPATRAERAEEQPERKTARPPRRTERSRPEAPQAATPLEPEPRQPEPHPVATTPEAPLEAAARAFEGLGYRVEPAGDGLLLTADLGRRGYRVRLELAPPAPDAAAWRRLEEGKEAVGARYLAVLGQGGAQPPFGQSVARVDPAALERLFKLTRLAPIGPLDLEGYWNAGGLGPDAADSLEASASHQVAARGAFSYTALFLARFPAHAVVTAEEAAAALVGPSVTRAAVLETLETLSKAPFMLLQHLGGGEYYLRQPMSVALGGLADYASSLRGRLRPPERAAGVGRPG